MGTSEYLSSLGFLKSLARSAAETERGWAILKANLHSAISD